MKKLLSGCLMALLLVAPVFGKAKAASKKASSKAADVVTKQANPAISGRVLFSTSKMISFDVHPLSTTYLDTNPATVAGKKISLQVETLEQWSSGDSPALEELGFRVTLYSAGQLWKTLEIPKSPLGKNLAKGMVIGSAKTDELAFNVVVDDVQKEGKSVSGLTYSFSMVALTADAHEPSALAEPETAATPVAAPTGMVPTLVKKLLEKAQSLPPGQEKARVAILQKALLLTRAVANPAPETEALMADLEKQIGSSPAPMIVSATASGVQPIHSAAHPASGTTAVSDKPLVKTSQAVIDLYQQAQKLLALGQEPEARDCLRQAVDKDPGFFDGWMLIGQNALKNSKHARAQEAFQKALALRRENLDSAVGFFKASYYLGDPEAGLVVLRDLTQKAPQNMAARQALAEAYFQAGDDENCSEECRQILNQNPKYDAARELLEKCAKRMK